MNSDDSKQEIIDHLASENMQTPMFQVYLAQRAISIRDYSSAIAWVDKYLKTDSMENKSSVYALYLYLLGVTGRIEEANTLLSKIIPAYPPGGENMRFIVWLHDNFAIDIPKGYLH